MGSMVVGVQGLDPNLALHLHSCASVGCEKFLLDVDGSEEEAAGQRYHRRIGAAVGVQRGSARPRRRGTGETADELEAQHFSSCLYIPFSVVGRFTDHLDALIVLSMRLLALQLCCLSWSALLHQAPSCHWRARELRDHHCRLALHVTDLWEPTPPQTPNASGNIDSSSTRTPMASSNSRLPVCLPWAENAGASFVKWRPAIRGFN